LFLYYYLHELDDAAYLGQTMDWDAIRQFAEEDIVKCLQSNPEFSAATNIRK
jgi:hypothetical protein